MTQEIQEFPEDQAERENEVRTVKMVNQETTVKKVPQVLPDKEDHEGRLENKGHQEHKD